MVTGDTVNYRATASFSDPNVGNNKPVNVYSYLYGPQSRNYNVVDTSTHVYTSNIHPLKLTYESGVVQLVKEYDGTTDAIVLVDATPTNVVNNDNVTLVSRAYYDTPDAGDNKTITFGFQIANDPNNNYLAPDSYVYSNAGRIILPTIIDTTFGNHGLLIATSHLCPGSQFNGTFAITQGTPTYYTLSFDENAIAQGFQNGQTITIGSDSYVISAIQMTPRRGGWGRPQQPAQPDVITIATGLKESVAAGSYLTGSEASEIFRRPEAESHWELP